MNFSKRIKTIANEIYYDNIADIGADHCYLPIYCIYNNKIKKAIACDISKKSLIKGIKNIKKYSYEEYIEVRVGNGLKPLKINESNSVIISGMGGHNIINILENGKSIVKCIDQLVLQPQSGIKEVRKYIHRINFKIVNEEFIKEDKKYYNIINCIRGSDSRYSNTDYILGKILLEKGEKLFKNYIKSELQKTHEILNKVDKLSYKKKENIEHLKQRAKMYEEELKQYEDKM